MGRNKQRFSLRDVIIISLLITLFVREFSNKDVSTMMTRTTKAATTSGSGDNNWDPKVNPLAIPPGQARNLPSIQVHDVKLDQNRGKGFGGTGDAKHLGGFVKIDPGGLNPTLWKYMIETLGVKSFLDVGCGRGISTSWFATHGATRVMCVEGSHDAVTQTLLPDPETQLVEHDYSRGPWWPLQTYDVAWSVEFLEHVNVQFHYNYVTTFRKAALLFVTSARSAGWHHVEVHHDDWWIRKYESYGFRYDPDLTAKAKKIVKDNQEVDYTPDGRSMNGYYIRASLKVFVNPVVAALPEHVHLFPELGCFDKLVEGSKIKNRECSESKYETPLDESMYPLKLTPDMDEKWMTLLKEKTM